MRHVIPSQLDYRPQEYATFYGCATVQRRGSFSYAVTRDGVNIGRIAVTAPGEPTLYYAVTPDNSTYFDRDTLHECAEALSLHATESAQ